MHASNGGDMRDRGVYGGALGEELKLKSAARRRAPLLSAAALLSYKSVLR